MEHNAGQTRGSTATVVYELKNESSHVFDICDQLVFSTIATARVFFTAEGTGSPSTKRGRRWGVRSMLISQSP